MVNMDSYYISKNDTRSLKNKGEKERLTQIEQVDLVFLKKTKMPLPNYLRSWSNNPNREGYNMVVICTSSSWPLIEIMLFLFME